MQETNEDRIRSYVRRHAKPSRDETAKALRLSPGQIDRSQAWQEYENQLLANFLDHATSPTLQSVQEEFGWSYAKTSKKPAWRAYQASKPAPEPPVGQLRDTTAAQITDPTALTSEDIAANRDLLFQLMVSHAQGDTKKNLKRVAKSASSQGQLLDHVINTVGEPDGRSGDALLTLCLEIASTWLDCHYERRRHPKGGAPRCELATRC